MTNLIDDLSVLTNVSESTLKKFLPITNTCICHSIAESICAKKDITEIDIGIGELHIKVEHERIKYRFIPSKELESSLISTVTSGSSPIVKQVDFNLQEKIDKAYKELL